MSESNKYFHGKRKIRAADYEHPHTRNELEEIYKCSEDFIYFCVNYIKIVDQDTSQLIPFSLYDYQREMYGAYENNNRVIVLAPRQSGKSVFTIAYLLWYATFYSHKNIVLVANKEKTARKTLKKLCEMYYNLPFFLKQGALEWNKLNISFENGSNIYAEATAASGNRGDSVAILYIDECAIIESGIWSDFYSSVYPTISSVKTSKIIISSTPKGFNHFYEIWTLAKNKQSDYVPIRVKWNDVPGRDEKYKEKTIAELGGGSKGLRKWRQEYECYFVGSGGTLIEGTKLEKLQPAPIVESLMDDRLLIYEYPREYAFYIIGIDVAEGVGEDYSTCQVLKLDFINGHKQVAVFRDNLIKTNEFHLIIEAVAEKYNDALIVVEANTYGREVLNRLVYESEAENVFFANEEKDHGIKSNRANKKVGNAYLKTNIESNKIVICDLDTISEFSKYIKIKDSYAAESGQNDDLVTPLVIISYFLSNKMWLENWIDIDDVGSINKIHQQIKEEILPMGFICDGSENINLSGLVNSNDELEFE